MDAWQTLTADVASTLAGLPDMHFLVLMTGPPPPRRRFHRADPDAQPGYVQFRFADGILMGECAARGEEQVAAVRAIGWDPPDPLPYWLHDSSTNHWRAWPQDEAGQAAELAVAGLRALGLTDPGQVVREQGR
ncbi:MAG: hypothetical protein JWN17_1192 [Frankiales bacterium]|nr:hypothetical protein [Frankiales bacterium]